MNYCMLVQEARSRGRDDGKNEKRPEDSREQEEGRAARRDKAQTCCAGSLIEGTKEAVESQAISVRVRHRIWR